MTPAVRLAASSSTTAGAFAARSPRSRSSAEVPHPAGLDVHLPHDALIAQPRRADVPRGETNGYFPGGVFEYRKTYVASAEDSRPPRAARVRRRLPRRRGVRERQPRRPACVRVLPLHRAHRPVPRLRGRERDPGRVPHASRQPLVRGCGDLPRRAPRREGCRAHRARRRAGHHTDRRDATALWSRSPPRSRTPGRSRRPIASTSSSSMRRARSSAPAARRSPCFPARGRPPDSGSSSTARLCGASTRRTCMTCS